jgi:hypothetical protein
MQDIRAQTEMLRTASQFLIVVVNSGALLPQLKQGASAPVLTANGDICEEPRSYNQCCCDCECRQHLLEIRFPLHDHDLFILNLYECIFFYPLLPHPAYGARCHLRDHNRYSNNRTIMIHCFLATKIAPVYTPNHVAYIRETRV